MKERCSNRFKKPEAQYKVIGNLIFLFTPERNYHFIVNIGGILDGKRK